MFPRLQLSDPLERWAVGLTDCVLAPIATLRRLRPRPTTAPPRAILLVRLERIGDLLMSLGAIRAVRERAPGARIELIVGSWNEPLARLVPWVDRIETLDLPWLARGAPHAGLGALVGAALGWRRRRFDLAINFEGDIRSNVLLWLSGALRRVGFGMAGGGPLLTDCVPYDPHAHVAANSLRLIEWALGSAPGAAPGPAPRLVVPASARDRAEVLLGREAPAGPIVGIHASGGRRIKQWDPGRFAEVAARVAQSHGARIVLTGSAADRPDVDRLKAGLPAGMSSHGSHRRERPGGPGGGARAAGGLRDRRHRADAPCGGRRHPDCGDLRSVRPDAVGPARRIGAHRPDRSPMQSVQQDPQAAKALRRARA